MLITIPRLIAVGLQPTQARAFAEPLAEACTKFGIDTAQRLAGFIGQCMIESARFTKLEENLFYRDPARIAGIFRTGFDLDGDRVVDPEEIEFARGYVGKPRELANRAYANRGGNGDEASGDGWRYRGRGLIQLSLLDNYAAAQRDLGRPYLTEPDLVAQPVDACLTAARYWEQAGCNTLADMRNWDGCTLAVNGKGMLHRAERATASNDALAALRA